MAFVTQVIEDSHRNYVIKVVGTPVDTAALLVDVSAMAIPAAAVKLMEVSYDVGTGDVVQLLWDATSDTALLTLSEGPGQTLCFRHIGGINNDSGAGKTGDVLITSAGTAQYSLTLWFVKKSPVIPL